MIGGSLLALVVPLTMGLVTGSDSDSDTPNLTFRRLMVAEDGFAVRLPGQPVSQQRSIEAPDGTYQWSLYGVEYPERAFLISSVQYPESAAQRPPSQILGTARDGAVNQARGVVLQDREITLDRHPGRAFRFAFRAKTGRQGVARSRIYWANGRLYQLMVLGDEAKVNDDDSDRFLESLELLDEDAADQR